MYYFFNIKIILNIVYFERLKNLPVHKDSIISDKQFQKGKIWQLKRPNGNPEAP